ncbi:hypothetical protein SALBM311S_03774 [Streptomyces alboniger]
MIAAWTGGLARHRTGRLLAALAGIALAVALVASLGSFLTASKATMTQRALRSVAVDWQVQVQPGADPNTVLSLVHRSPGTRTALPVGYAHTSAFTARVQGSTQTTGPGMALGLPDGYRTRFPDAVRLSPAPPPASYWPSRPPPICTRPPVTPSVSSCQVPACAR